MRVVVLGYQPWGCITLRALLTSRHEVPLVITHPESHDGCEGIFDGSVAKLAADHGVPVLVMKSANHRDALSILSEAKPDVIICSNWRTWLCPEACGCARLAAINIHDSLLPKYGGFAPISWAVANGESEVGVTVHAIEEEIDLGPILLQHSVPVRSEETATDLIRKTMPLFAAMPLEVLDQIERGQTNPRPQDRSQFTFYHKRDVRDCWIDWRCERRVIFNLIRAQSDPFTNARTEFEGAVVCIKKASLPDLHFKGTPGRMVRRTERGVVVLCGQQGEDNQGIVLEVVQGEGTNCVDANSFFTRMGMSLGPLLPRAVF